MHRHAHLDHPKASVALGLFHDAHSERMELTRRLWVLGSPHTPVCMCPCVYVSVRTHLCACAHVYMCQSAHTCVCVPMCICVRMRAQAHKHTCTHAHMHTCTHVHMHTWTHAHMCTCTHAHMHTCAHIHTCICTHMHMCICTVICTACVWICTCYMCTCVHCIRQGRRGVHACMPMCTYAYVRVSLPLLNEEEMESHQIVVAQVGGECFG